MRAKKWEILLALFTGAVAGSGCAFAFGIASARADDVVEMKCGDDVKMSGYVNPAPDVVYDLPDDDPASLARLSVVEVTSNRATQVVAHAENGKVKMPCRTGKRYVFSLR